MSGDKEISATKVRYLVEKATDMLKQDKHVAEEMLKLSQDEREWVRVMMEPALEQYGPEIDALNEQLEREEIEHYGRTDSGEVREDAEASSADS